MEIRHYSESAAFSNVAGDILALDLELANSFRAGPGVICMVGIEHYDPSEQLSKGVIAYITEQDEEPALVEWLMEELRGFHHRHQKGRLLTFSGLDNDVRWLEERLTRFGLASPGGSPLDLLKPLDLRVEFRRRTQNDRVSLKKLEEIFGIERSSAVTSKKVSYILTDILRKGGKGRAIPEKLFDYLREDVHNLFCIHDQWEQTRLDFHNLTESEFHTFVTSIINTVGKFLKNQKSRNGYRKQLPALKEYQTDMQAALEKTIRAESFEQFELPGLPAVRINHSEFERIVKKHHALKGIEVVDGRTGAYRLKREFFRPKGALAVVKSGEKVLMIRRAEHLERSGGFWGLPGGVVEEGETPPQSAARELWEEVNLAGKIVATLGSSISVNGQFELTWVLLEVEDISTLHPDPEEVSEVRWVSPRELPRLQPLIPGAVEGFVEFLGKEWGESS